MIIFLKKNKNHNCIFIVFFVQIFLTSLLFSEETKISSRNVPKPPKPHTCCQTGISSISEVLPIRYPLVDCHLHFVNFIQQTDGIQALLKAMKQCGVEEVMISGMPLVKEWSNSETIKPHYYLDDDARCYWYSATDIIVARAVLSLSQQDRKKFHPFICGFNAADKNAIEHVKRMVEWYPDLWEGIGEIMTRHDDLTALTYGQPAHADYESLDPIYEFAAEKNMPVAIHSDVSSVWRHEPLYLQELENAVKRHPKTKIIWCHAGISRRIMVPDMPSHIRRLLKTYQNIWIDLSWVVYECYLMNDDVSNKAWVDLVEEFPDRFMIGSDIVGSFGTYYQQMQKYYSFLDAMKPETVKMVAQKNFLSLLPKKPATL